MSTIVMAANHPTYLEMMKVLLEYIGEYQVVSMCTDGLTALAHVYARTPDMVVIDIDRPGSDGLELIRRMRKDGFDQPILAVSSACMSRTARRAGKAGASGLVHKAALLGELTVAARVVLQGGVYFPAYVRYGSLPGSERARSSEKQLAFC